MHKSRMYTFYGRMGVGFDWTLIKRDISEDEMESELEHQSKTWREISVMSQEKDLKK